MIVLSFMSVGRPLRLVVASIQVVVAQQMYVDLLFLGQTVQSMINKFVHITLFYLHIDWYAMVDTLNCQDPKNRFTKNVDNVRELNLLKSKKDC